MWHNWAVTCESFELWEEALERNERAFALGPQDFDVLLNRGNILDKLGRTEEALAAYTAAEQALPPNETDLRSFIWAARGNRLYEAERHAEVEAEYAQAITLRADNSDAWHNRATNEGQWGLAERTAGHHNAARAHFIAGLQYNARALNPNDTDTQSLRSALQQVLANS